MAETSKIEWTDSTWNPITGCSVVSPGCTNCYAMRLAGTRLRHHPSRAGLTRDTKAGPVWNGEVRLNEQWLDQPLRWRRPRMIFVCAHGDLFHEAVPDAWIDRVFAVMALAPQHTFQALTKRAERMRSYLSETALYARILRAASGLRATRPALCDVPISDPTKHPDFMPHIWLGTSCEDQARADERIPHLLATPAAVRFVSYEPALGPINISWYLEPRWYEMGVPGQDPIPGLDWVITGGESGRGARPMHPAWARSIRDQCRAAGVPFFFKQWGEWGNEGHPEQDHPVIMNLAGDVTDARKPPWLHRRLHESQAIRYRVGKKAAGRLLDGREWNEMPEPRHA